MSVVISYCSKLLFTTTTDLHKYSFYFDSKPDVDWKYLYCAQDCPTSGPLSSPTCGGSAEPWQHLWSSAEECCSAHLSWQSLDFCTKFGHPGNLSELNSLSANRQEINRGGISTQCWRSGTPCSSMADSFACCSICSEGYCL